MESVCFFNKHLNYMHYEQHFYTDDEKKSLFRNDLG